MSRASYEDCERELIERATKAEKENLTCCIKSEMTKSEKLKTLTRFRNKVKRQNNCT
ncbi:hypothetical protein D051_0153 [Vibrio parahaemolyticus VPCR-2010]|nr:hypothetical protein D051_0153 [Vibrio parahaemolyticus VPCR-2010]